MKLIIHREQLIALGWLISHCGLFQRYTDKVVAAREAKAPKVPLPPYPQDTSSIPGG
jgi:hypothetical protein